MKKLADKVSEHNFLTLLEALPKGIIPPKVQEYCAKNQIATIFDMLCNFPSRYQDWSKLADIRKAKDGELCLLEAVVLDQRFLPYKRTLFLELENHKHSFETLLFNVKPFMLGKLARGQKLKLYGKVQDEGYCKKMLHPFWQQVKENTPHLPEIIPLYQGADRYLSKLIGKTLGKLLESLLISQKMLLEEKKLLAFFRIIHQYTTPVSKDFVANIFFAKEQLLTYELASIQLAQAVWKANYEQQLQDPPPIAQAHEACQKLQESLAFKLTQDQHSIIDKLHQQIYAQQKLRTLVQGEVGSGKTIIALLASLPVLLAGFDVCLMAPTEILAQQHFSKATEIYAQFGVKIQLVTQMTAKKYSQESFAESGKGNKGRMIIGTHALLNPENTMPHLALLIIDEQQCFGVEQRYALLEKSPHNSHQILLSATPIPRTLLMTLFGDLDVASLHALPPGRQASSTLLMSTKEREKLIQKLHKPIAEANSCFWVCNVISKDPEGEEEFDLKGLEKYIQEHSNFSTSVLHGKMPSKSKTKIMQDFQARKFQILIATTVIQVGIDIPHANFIVIENPHLLGLSQLHQLRGRVGRAGGKGYCILLFPENTKDEALERLQFFRDNLDGFQLADYDLQTRGGGSIFGTEQSGHGHFKIKAPLSQKMLDESKNLKTRMLQQMSKEAQKTLITTWVSDDLSKIEIA